ncbi:MAG: HAD family hydrolase [Erysipelotrichaceae bacterium]|nr:HAD family hydrolase [Erysipelotrichaceae bacterium]MDD3809101.1 HAD family hydrolase [Erysipelotrichaceae bacterium]
MNQKYFFFDIDGTLVDFNAGIDRITPKTIEALNELKNRSHQLLVATGRSICFIPDFVKEYDFNGFVTCNGAYVELHGKSLYKAVIHQEAIREVMTFCENTRSNYYFESRDAIYIRDASDPMHQKFIREWSMDARICIDRFDYDRIETYIGMLVCQTPEVLEQAAQCLGKYFDVQPHVHGCSCDLTLKGESKGKGIEMLCAHLNVDITNTVAFGDAHNDYEMISNVGLGIVMGNGVKELKKIGDYTTLSVRDEGIFHALKDCKFI